MRLDHERVLARSAALTAGAGARDRPSRRKLAGPAFVRLLLPAPAMAVVPDSRTDGPRAQLLARSRTPHSVAPARAMTAVGVSQLASPKGGLRLAIQRSMRVGICRRV